MRTNPALRALVGLGVAALTLTATSGAALALPARPVVPALAAAVSPPTPSGLPSGIEDLARYVPANSCDPTAKPGTTALGTLLTSTYPGTSYGISRTCGTDPLPTSEHYDGRAVDWMTSVRVPAQRANAEAFLSWLFATDRSGHTYANARRLGVMYVIWNNKIWGSYRASEGWRPYSSCAAHPEHAYDTTCHRDHIHVSLSWEGAMGRTSFWSRQVAPVDYGPCRAADLNWASPYTGFRGTPCPSYPHVSAPRGASSLLSTLTTYSGMYVAKGFTGPVVKAVQQAVGAGADGVFGSLTQSALLSWQSRHGLAQTGVVDPATWRALLASYGASGSSPSPAPAPSSNPLSRYRYTILKTGSRGDAVVALQKRLAIPQTAYFGRGTRHAVNRWKSAHHLPVDGVVRHGMWMTLGA